MSVKNIPIQILIGLIAYIFAQNFDMQVSNTKPNQFSIVVLDKNIQFGIVSNL